MTLLIVSPDYASHLLPLASLGAAWLAAGERVVVATGPATRSIVDSFGFEYTPLELGRGSNPGVIRAEEQPAGEDESLRGFFAATREGMVETLAYQARARLDDLMWQPVEKARAVQGIVREVAPQAIIVDHLAFSARLGLDAMGARYGDVVLGHPSALPLSDEVYGFPPAWPTAFAPSTDELSELRTLCEQVSARFTDEWNGAAAALGAPALDRPAFEHHGDLLLFNYPGALSPAGRSDRLPPHVFLGSSVRTEPRDAEVEEWIASSDLPIAYVSFGSFLSVRSDVLARVVRAIEAAGLRGAIASGSADPGDLGVVPKGFLVRGFLPQVALLSHAAVAVTHGGNNSVTEAVTAGVPLLVLPFSTDQFAGAAAIEDAAIGVALAPNTASVAELTAGILGALGLEDRSRGLAESLAQSSGSARAFDALTDSAADSSTS